jgi:4-deoxy-L-threo-5-hexosulose-uronate ketol-isomerase
MEAYLYFDLAAEARVFHMMGEPERPGTWSCQRGGGDLAALVDPLRRGHRRYTFIWAMAGDNVDYRDVEMVAMEDLR